MATTPAPSFTDLFNTGKAEAQNRRPELTFDAGDISEMEMAAAAAMADHILGYIAERIKATYLDGAEEDDLTTLADDHWAIQRQVAIQATGTVMFTRAAGGLAGSIDAGTVVATQRDSLGNEIQFITDAPLNFLTTDLSQSVNVVAALAGSTGNVAAGTVNRIISTLFDTFAVTNATRMVGGAEEEADDALRDRVRLYPTTLRRGTLAALEYGAKTVAGVAVATAVEDAGGIVTVYVADASGNSSTPMQTAVQTELENWRPAGSVVQTAGGSLVAQNVNVSLVLSAGAVISSTDVIAAITARLAKMKIGETLTVDVIKQTILNIDPDVIISVTVNTPTGSVVPTAGQIIRAGTVTVS